MQRPRRTSEFQEDGTATKRQPKVSRPGSLDHASSGISSVLRPSCSSALRPSCSSAGRRTVTPQRMNLGPGRVLFTAEKRPNDKKWAHEQIQHVLEYLRQVDSSDMQSIAAELSTRGGVAARMTIKQFVCIINYFLPFVCGNRFKVNLANHVDDIVNTMHKLNYPHQLNKSSLKTPNAQHSLIHVAMLLDFLMEFAPPHSEEQLQAITFPFRDIEMSDDHKVDNEDEEFQMPDCEFRALLFAHAKEGFRLWDRQKNEELDALQQQTTNVLIQKRCGVESAIALDGEIKRLRSKLTEIEQQRVRIPNKKLEQHRQAEEKLNRIIKELETAEEEFIADQQQLQQLRAQRQQTSQQMSTIQQEIAQLQANIRDQACTIAQRDKMIDEMGQMKHILQCKVRTIRELQEKHNHQQVMLSRTKKQLATEVEKFNGHLREVAYTMGRCITNINLDDCQLTHNAEQKDVQRLVPLLQQIQKSAKKYILEDETLVQQLQKETANISIEIDTKLEPRSIALQSSIATVRTVEHELLHKFKTDSLQLDDNLMQLDQQLQYQDIEISECNKQIMQQQAQLHALKEQNESTMTNAEKEYYAYATERESFLDQYEIALSEANAKFDALEKTIKEFNLNL